MTQLSEHFTEDEFKCHHCGKVHVDPALLAKLEVARDLYGKPMHILSGYRCQAHNTNVGGAQHSQHVEGKAVDIQVTDGHDRFTLVNALLIAGFTRIGLYAKGWVHVDVGEQPSEVMWVE